MVAHAPRLFRPFVCHERAGHGVRLPARRLSALRVFPLMTMASEFDQGVVAKQRLAVAAVAALLGAGLILVMFVLPAEYGVDPLGTGAWVGLTELGATGKQIEALESSA